MELPYKISHDIFVALLAIDSIGLLDEHHAMFQTIQEYGKYVSEVHVLVFLQERRHVPKNDQVKQIASNIWVYYVSPPLIRSPFIESIRLRKIVHRHLVWQRKFRPDFILSFSVDTAGVLTEKLSRKYKKAFFIENPCLFFKLPFVSLVRQKQLALIGRAEKIFVPSLHMKELVAKELDKDPNLVLVVPPFFDKNRAEGDDRRFNFREKYPHFLVFCVSYISYPDHHALKSLREIMKTVVSGYQPIALILYTPEAYVKRVRNFFKTDRKNTHIFVEKEPESLIPHFRGAHMTLLIGGEGEIDTPLIEALTAHSPVICSKTATSISILSNSTYKEYLVTESDTDAVAEKVLYLIGNPQARDEYRINASSVLKNQFSETLESHVKEVIESILSLYKK